MKNPLLTKSYRFSVRIVQAFKYLSAQRAERSLLTQLLRSGTSIGANIEETQGAFSKRDFTYKIQTAYKEAKETHYWIRLLTETNFFDVKISKSLQKRLRRTLKANDGYSKDLSPAIINHHYSLQIIHY